MTKAPNPIKRPPKPRLSGQEFEDAAYMARDQAWVAVASMFDDLSEADEITYESLASRIGRSKSQVHRWINSSSNVTLKSLGILAAGMDSEVSINLIRCVPDHTFSNQCHPAEAAATRVGMYLQTFGDDVEQMLDLGLNKGKFKRAIETSLEVDL